MDPVGRESPNRESVPVRGRSARTERGTVSTQAWEAVAAGRHTLIAAPTGSGKTLAGFLSAIDALVRDSRRAPLPDATRVVYVSPLKALGSDVHKNLEVPLAGIDRALAEAGEPGSGIRAMVRTGDTPGAAREAMRRQPPHILVTTPESLYILLTSEGGRAMLASAETAIVDEIHAVAGNKRGAHLALSLERLDAPAGRPLTRIGLQRGILPRPPLLDTWQTGNGDPGSRDERRTLQRFHQAQALETRRRVRHAVPRLDPSGRRPGVLRRSAQSPMATNEGP